MVFVVWHSNSLTHISEIFQSVVINGSQFKPALLQYGVPLESVLCPVLFTLYTQPVSHVICRHKCGFHKFDDDTQLRKSAQPCDFRLLTCRFEYCIKEIKQWMSCNKLKLNADKTEAVTFGTHLRRNVSCGEHEIPFKPFVKKKKRKKRCFSRFKSDNRQVGE